MKAIRSGHVCIRSVPREVGHIEQLDGEDGVCEKVVFQEHRLGSFVHFAALYDARRRREPLSPRYRLCEIEAILRGIVMRVGGALKDHVKRSALFDMSILRFQGLVEQVKRVAKVAPIRSILVFGFQPTHVMQSHVYHQDIEVHSKQLFHERVEGVEVELKLLSEGGRLSGE